ncbi:hypothetical protein QBC45DRAFT_487568, partial [Copromyces sp. CBS 386.78]
MITINEWTIYTMDVVDSTKMVDVVIDMPSGVSEMVIYAPTNVPDVVIYERPEDAAWISADLATVVPEYIFSVAKREAEAQPASTPTVTAVAKATGTATATDLYVDHETFVRGTRRRSVTAHGTFALGETAVATDAPGFVGVASAASGHDVASAGNGVDAEVVEHEDIAAVLGVVASPSSSTSSKVSSLSTGPAFTVTVVVTEVVSTSSTGEVHVSSSGATHPAFTHPVLTSPKAVPEVISTSSHGSSSFTYLNPAFSFAAPEVVTEVVVSSSAGEVSSSTGPSYTATTTVTVAEFEIIEVDEVSSLASTSTSTHKPRKNLSTTIASVGSTTVTSVEDFTTTVTVTGFEVIEVEVSPSASTPIFTSTGKPRKTPSTTTHKPRKIPSTTIASVGSTTVTSVEAFTTVTVTGVEVIETVEVPSSASTPTSTGKPRKSKTLSTRAIIPSVRRSTPVTTVEVLVAANTRFSTLPGHTTTTTITVPAALPSAFVTTTTITVPAALPSAFVTSKRRGPKPGNPLSTLKSIPSLITPAVVVTVVPPVPTRSTLDDAKEGCIECQDIFEDKGLVPPETWEWPDPVLASETWEWPDPPALEVASVEKKRSLEEGGEYGGRGRPKGGKLIPVAEEEANDIDPAGLTVDVDFGDVVAEKEANDIDPAGLIVDGEDEDVDGEGEVKDKVTTRRRQLVPPEVNDKEFAGPGLFVPSDITLADGKDDDATGKTTGKTTLQLVVPPEVNETELNVPGLFIPSSISLTNNHANGVTASVEDLESDAPVKTKTTRQLVPPEVHVTDPDILAGPSPFLPSNITTQNHTVVHSTTTNTSTADDPDISIPADFVPYNDTIHTNTTNSGPASLPLKVHVALEAAAAGLHVTNPAGTDPLPLPAPGSGSGSGAGSGEPPLDKSEWHGSTLPKDFVFGETLLPLDKAAFTGVFNRKFGVTDPAKSPLNQAEPADSPLASKAQVAGLISRDTLSSLSPLSSLSSDETDSTQSPASPLININLSAQSAQLSSTCNCAHNKDAHHWRDTMSPMDRATEICMSGGGCKITH